MEILGSSILKNDNLARLLISKEFTRIKVDDQDTRLHYFSEAKACCQRQLKDFMKEGTRKLFRMSVKERAREVLRYKYRFEAFLVEIARGLDLFPGDEALNSSLDLRLRLHVGGDKGLWAAIDRTSCYIVRGLLCSSRGCANFMLKESEPKVFFDQYLQEELEILQGLEEKDLMGRSVGSRIRRGRNTVRYMVGKE